jgi:opacity protein-like surface antigen
MRSWRQMVSLAVICASVALSSAPASAEWFGDLFLGGAFTQNSEPSAKTSVAGVPVTITTKDLHHDDSIVFGGRFGYWIDQFPYLGVGLDVSHFNADASPQTRDVVFAPDLFGQSGPGLPSKPVDIGVTAISFDLMLRWPLMTSPAFPKGRLQPYVAAGPAVFIVNVKDHGNLGPGTQSESSASVGVKVAGGLTWLFTSWIGVFTEYRFTHFNPETTFPRSADIVTGAPISATGSNSLSTHQVVAGVTLRF